MINFSMKRTEELIIIRFMIILFNIILRKLTIVELLIEPSLYYPNTQSMSNGQHI